MEYHKNPTRSDPTRPDPTRPDCVNDDSVLRGAPPLEVEQQHGGRAMPRGGLDQLLLPNHGLDQLLLPTHGVRRRQRCGEAITVQQLGDIEDDQCHVAFLRRTDAFEDGVGMGRGMPAVAVAAGPRGDRPPRSRRFVR